MDDKLIIEINEKDLEEFKQICKKSDISAETAIKTFIENSLKKGKFPYKIKVDSFYSETNQALLKKSIKELEETGGTIYDIDLDS